jgi:fimbrial chaperone protein
VNKRLGRAISTGILCLVVSLGFVFGKAESVLASTVAVSPVNIFLTSDTPSALLTLTNQGSERVSFEISLYSWNQSDAGAMQLAPTSDVIFFPSLVTLSPGEARNIRIGTVIKPGQVEKTYRLFLEELPSPRTRASDHGRVHVRLLSKISLPVFLEPDKVRFNTSISDVTVHNRALSFKINNGGTTHILPQAVNVSAKDHAGNVLFQRTAIVWYILPGESSKVGVDLPARTCAEIRLLSISLETDTEVVKKSFEPPVGACTR